jgi:GNAT superfamily N-acetyltransferase
MEWFDKLKKEYGILDGFSNPNTWIAELSRNRDIKASVASSKLDCMINIALASENYNKFITKLHFDKVKWVDVDDRTYREIIAVPENPYEQQSNIQMWSNNVVVIRTKDFALTLNPYNGGVMVQGLIIDENKRGRGIGTKVMNKLYDLSEKLDIPLYLTPYPDELCDKSELWSKIHKLRKWYEGLGFGPVFGSDWIWSNYFEEDIK